MRVLITAIFVLINFILQSTVFQHLQIRGILPNTAVLLVVSYALLRGSTEGAIVGFFTGLLQDIFFGSSLGYYTLLGMMTGYFAGRGNHNFYRENYIMPIMVCSVAVFLYETVVYFTGFFFRGELNLLYYYGRVILPETVYSAVFTIFIYRILFAANEWLELKEKYRYRRF